MKHSEKFFFSTGVFQHSHSTVTQHCAESLLCAKKFLRDNDNDNDNVIKACTNTYTAIRDIEPGEELVIDYKQMTREPLKCAFI